MDSCSTYNQITQLTKTAKIWTTFGTSITESIQIALLDGCESSQKLDCIRLRQVKIKRCKHIHFTAQYIIGLICTITKISKIINGWSKNILLVWCPGWVDHLVRSGFGPGYGRIYLRIYFFVFCRNEKRCYSNFLNILLWNGCFASIKVSVQKSNCQIECFIDH